MFEVFISTDRDSQARLKGTSGSKNEHMNVLLLIYFCAPWKIVVTLKRYKRSSKAKAPSEYE